MSQDTDSHLWPKIPTNVFVTVAKWNIATYSVNIFKIIDTSTEMYNFQHKLDVWNYRGITLSITTEDNKRPSSGLLSDSYALLLFGQLGIAWRFCHDRILAF